MTDGHDQAAFLPPQPLPDLTGPPEPEDKPYPGVLQLRVDATDVRRAIFRVHERIPVTGPGKLYLVYPKWLPGFHAPQAPVELFAGLELEANGRPLTWRRHPVEVTAFRVDVPADVEVIEARFQFLSPTDPAQGGILCDETMLCLPWYSVLLHPGGVHRAADQHRGQPDPARRLVAGERAGPGRTRRRYPPLRAHDIGCAGRFTGARRPSPASRVVGRAGASHWQPCFEKPIRNSLMWVYEGLTQYWTHVLCARAGLWTAAQTRDAIAWNAARHNVRPGSRWRPLIDTTRDPIIAARSPLPWPSWQRSEDYYGEGALIWLDVDTRLREPTGEARSLDDFARAFFGGDHGDWRTRTYRYDDVVAALRRIAAFDWDELFERALTRRHDHAPLAGIERGGYRLGYRGSPSAYQAAYDRGRGQVDLTHSIGLTVTTAGKVRDVLWHGPAFDAGLTVGDSVTAVAGEVFSPDALMNAVRQTRKGDAIDLIVKRGGLVRAVEVACPDSARFPHLEPIDGAAARLDAILRSVPADRT